MTQYAYPEGANARYQTGGEINRIQAGDFFKCAVCRTFQRHEGRLTIYQSNAQGNQYCCAGCRTRPASTLPADPVRELLSAAVP